MGTKAERLEGGTLGPQTEWLHKGTGGHDCKTLLPCYQQANTRDSFYTTQEAGEALVDKCNEILGENKVSGPSYYGRSLDAICLKHPDLMERNNGKGDKKRTMRKIIEAQMDH